MTAPQFREFGVSFGRNLPCSRVERRQSIPIFDKILPPANTVNVIEQHLHLSTHQQTLESRILDVDIGNVPLYQFIDPVSQSARELLSTSAKLPLHGKRKGGYGTLHAFQCVDPQELDQAFLPIHLMEEAVAAL